MLKTGFKEKAKLHELFVLGICPYSALRDLNLCEEVASWFIVASYKLQL